MSMVERVEKRGNKWCVVHGHPKKKGSKRDKPPGTAIHCYKFGSGTDNTEDEARQKAFKMHYAIAKSQERRGKTEASPVSIAVEAIISGIPASIVIERLLGN